MADTLESVMTKAYDDLKDELHLKRNHSLVKTYILEAHSSSGFSHNALLNLLREIFQESHGARRLAATVSETQEENLFTVSGSRAKGEFFFFIDTADSRFWLAHAISKSDTSALVIDQMLGGSSNIDSAWMPMELLKYIQRLGTPRGLALDFDRRYMDRPFIRRGKAAVLDAEESSLARHEKSDISTGDHFEYVKMQLWGEGTNRILDALSDAGLTNSTTISKVRLRTEAESNSDLFSLADIKYDGKITGRGSSFAVYNGLLTEVLNRYATAVRSAEDKFRIHWRAESGRGKMFGQPFYIRLGPNGVPNLEHFCAKLFSGAEPFKLMGVPIRRNDNYYTVSAVDLHINQRIDFEVSRNTLSIFLPQKSCGNSLLRIYTNLQHFYSSDVKAIDGSGSGVFTF